MRGAEVAWRTLRRESVAEPCIIAAWMMKREFFQRFAGVRDIYRDPVRTAVDAFAASGCNLNPQFIMPCPVEEHLACDPFSLPPAGRASEAPASPDTRPEDVRDDVRRLTDQARPPGAFDPREEARTYARHLRDLTSRSRDRTLYIGHFHRPSFMDGYTRWTYDSYLSALVLYPDDFTAYFRSLGEEARVRNQAIRDAVKEYGIASVVYGGDDICFNNGPVCSVELLDRMYFPALRRAVEPLAEAGIDIVWHSDGNVLPLAERLIGLGVTGFQGFQEREAGIPLERMVGFRRRDGGKLIIFGSVSVVHTFPFGAEDDVKAEVERCFRAAAPGGGFCLAPSSSVLPETPMRNIEAFLRHGVEFGRRFLSGEVS